MHSALTNGFTYHGVAYTGDLSQIAAADNFLSIVIPQIMASQAYQDNGVIVIWTDESRNLRTAKRLLPHPDVYRHFEVGQRQCLRHRGERTRTPRDLATWQKVFGIRANTPSGYLNDARNAQLDGTTDISALFRSGVIPKSLPQF